MPIIRKFQEQDRVAVLHLGENFVYTPYRVDKKFRTLTTVIIPLLVTTQLENPRIQIFVACVQQKVVGFISFLLEQELSSYIFPNDTKLCASILFLSVDSNYRNQGIGSKLLDFCFLECEKQHVSILRIGTDFGNKEALSLYHKKGFNTILNWNIYRIYKDEIQAPLSKLRLQKMDLDFKKFPVEVLLKRPLSWFYDSKISRTEVHRFLIDKIRVQLRSKNIQWIQRKLDNTVLSLLIKRDRVREKYYGIKGSLWTISDLFESPLREHHASEFLKTMLNSLPDFTMAEYWVCDQDYETKQILLESGMKAIYGGIALKKDLSNLF